MAVGFILLSHMPERLPGRIPKGGKIPKKKKEKKEEKKNGTLKSANAVLPIRRKQEGKSEGKTRNGYGGGREEEKRKTEEKKETRSPLAESFGSSLLILPIRRN